MTLAPTRSRNWTDFDPDSGTFLDQDTGQRVNPDGSPAMPAPIAAVSPEPYVPPEQSAPYLFPPVQEPPSALRPPMAAREAVFREAATANAGSPAAEAIKGAVQDYGIPALERFESGARPIREGYIDPIGQKLDRAAAGAAARLEVDKRKSTKRPLGDLEQRPGESLDDYEQRIFDTNPPELMPGAIGIARAILDPFNVVGAEGQIVRGGAKAIRGAGQLATKGAKGVSEAAGPALRELAQAEVGLINLGGAEEEVLRNTLASLRKELLAATPEDAPSLVQRIEALKAQLPESLSPPSAAESPPKAAAERGAIGGAKEPWQMSPTELRTAQGIAKVSEQEADIKALGTDGAKEWNRLQRLANRATESEATRLAQQEIDRISAAFTPEQERLLFGIGETGPTVEDYGDFYNALDRLNFDNEESLGNSLKQAITKAKPGEVPDTHEAQIALAQIRYAHEHGRELGFDMSKVSEAALRGAASRFRDPEDAAFMLRDYRLGAGKAAELSPPLTASEPPRGPDLPAGEAPAPLTPEELRRAMDAGVKLDPNPDVVRAALEGKGFPYSVSTSAKEVGLTPEGMEIPRYYSEQRNTAALYNAAQDTIAIEGDVNASIGRLAAIERWTDNEVMQSVHVLKAIKGDLAAHQEWLKVMDQHGLIGGRETQAWSVIGRFSEEGMMLAAERMRQRAALAGGKKATPIIEQRIAKAAESEITQQAEAASAKVLAEAESELAKARKRIAQLENKPVRVSALRAQIDAIFGGQAGGGRFAADTVSYETSEQFLERAKVIAAMDSGPEQEALKRALLNELDQTSGKEARALAAQAAADKRRFTGPKATPEEKLAERAQAKELNNLKLLTENIIPEARLRAARTKAQTLLRLKQTTAKNGLALPDVLAQSFMDRANIIADMPAGMQQDRKYAEFMQDVANLLPPPKWGLALDLWGIPTTLKTMWDGGYMLRQGALLGARNPDVWLKTWGPMLKSMGFKYPKWTRGSKRPSWETWGGSEYAEQIQDQLATRPLANVAKEMGIIFDEIGSPNEFFSSKIAEKVPGVKGSQRSFVVPGNWLRNGSIDKRIKEWLRAANGGQEWDLAAHPINSIADLTAATKGAVTEQYARDNALLYNALSGKSNIQWLRKRPAPLGLPFFAPGWALSIPEAAGRTVFSPGARKEGARVLAGYFGFVTGAEMLGDLAGIWDAELDPRSSNFGKVRWKGTMEYTDPTLGMAGWLRLTAQLAPTQNEQGVWGQYHKTTSGNLVPQPWTETLFSHFLRGKLHPYPGEMWSWAEGHNIVGEKRIFSGLNGETALSILNTAKSLFAPLTPTDVTEGLINDGLTGAVLSTSSIVGLNTQSYSTFSDAQQKITDGMFPGQQYKQLDRGQRNQVNDSAEIKLLVDQMESRKVDIRDRTQDRYDRYSVVKDELEVGTEATATRPAVPGLRDFIEAGMTGEKLRKEIQDFKQNRYRAARDLLTEDVLAYSTQHGEIKLHDVFAQMWLDTPLEQDLQTGIFNYKKQDIERARILEQAQDSLKAAGRDSSYITTVGEGTFRKKSYKDPVVAKALEEYDKDQETLRPYWEARDVLQKAIPAYAKAQREHDALAGRPADQAEFDRTDYMWRLYQRDLDGDEYHDGEKMKLRRNKANGIQAAGEKWGYFGALAPLGQQSMKSMVPQLPQLSQQSMR